MSKRPLSKAEERAYDQLAIAAYRVQLATKRADAEWARNKARKPAGKAVAK